MKIVVCAKVVPVSDSIITLNSEGTGIDISNVKFDLNPYDEYAIEAAVQLKERLGGDIVAVSVGPQRDSTPLKRILALGADRLIHLASDDQPFPDSHNIAEALAETIKPLAPDIIFCGKLSIDTGNGLVGPLVARKLNLPFVTGICEISVETNLVKVSRETENGRAMIECSLPCLLTAEKGLNKPRYPSLKDILLSRKKEIFTQNISSISTHLQLSGLAYPQPRAAGIILGNDRQAVPELIRRLREDARVL